MSMADAHKTGYQYFLDAAREAEEFVRSQPGTTDEDLAEGYLYVAGAWEYHIERVFKGADLNRPCFVRDMDGFRTWGLPSPDQTYYSAQIDGNGEYRISGQRGHTADYCFEMLSGMIGDDGVMGRRFDALELKKIDFDEHGRYEIFVGGMPRARNWLKAGPDAREIFVRQTTADWRTEQPTPMLIERIDVAAADLPPQRPTMAEVDALYRKAAQRLRDQIRFIDNFFRNWPVPLNDMPAPSLGPPDSGYLPGQYNTAGRFEIGGDEALLVEIVPARARYQGLVIAHPVWVNSIAPRTRQSTLNAAQSRLSSDGVYRYVISVRDPGVPNWIDTGGHTRGFMFARYQQVSGEVPAKPTVRRVALEQLRRELPADEPVVSAAERAEVLRLRRLSIDRRFF